jgi:hypothetical protein
MNAAIPQAPPRPPLARVRYGEAISGYVAIEAEDEGPEFQGARVGIYGRRVRLDIGRRGSTIVRGVA